VSAGERSLSPLVSSLVQQSEADGLLSDAPPADPYELLTARERHIHQLLAEGNSNKDIASMLGLSLHTVETHRARIMEKLGVRSAAQLVIDAFRRGIVS
jgi:two-component system, NarL family, response regulator NreC